MRPWPCRLRKGSGVPPSNTRAMPGVQKKTRAETRVFSRLTKTGGGPPVERLLELNRRADTEDPWRDDAARLRRAQPIDIRAGVAEDCVLVEHVEPVEQQSQAVPASVELEGLLEADVQQLDRRGARRVFRLEAQPFRVAGDSRVTERTRRAAVDAAGTADDEGPRGALVDVQVRRRRDVPRELIAAL